MPHAKYCWLIMENQNLKIQVQYPFDFDGVRAVRSTTIKVMSHWAIYRQPVPGNLQEESLFSFKFSQCFPEDSKLQLGEYLCCWCSLGLNAVGCLQVVWKICPVWHGLADCTAFVQSKKKTWNQYQNANSIIIDVIVHVQMSWWKCHHFKSRFQERT